MHTLHGCVALLTSEYVPFGHLEHIEFWVPPQGNIAPYPIGQKLQSKHCFSMLLKKKSTLHSQTVSFVREHLTFTCESFLHSEQFLHFSVCQTYGEYVIPRTHGEHCVSLPWEQSYAIPCSGGHLLQHRFPLKSYAFSRQSSVDTMTKHCKKRGMA